MARSVCSGCHRCRARCRRTRTATSSQPANASSTSTSLSTIVNWTQARRITRIAILGIIIIRVGRIIGPVEGPLIIKLEMKTIIAGVEILAVIVITILRQEHLKMQMMMKKSKGSWLISKMASRLSASILSTSSPTAKTTSLFSAHQHWVALRRPSERTPHSPLPKSTTGTTNKPQHAHSAEVQTGEVVAPIQVSSNMKHILSSRPKVTNVKLMT